METSMQLLLRLSRAIDWVSEKIGAVIIWLVLAAVVISAVNAVIRKVFNIGSNAWLETQWYLFAAVFMLGAGYTFLHNAHVRIDFISTRLTPRTRNVIDIVGIVAFLAPLCWLLIDLSWPLFINAWNSGEMSQNAGGLVRWPVYLMIPAGMALLLAQAMSELIKRVAFLRGLIPDPLAHKEPGQAHGEEAAKALESAK
jgi:TRAP-type mannitol/chloroaromatic compound transport system permease small subunit